MPTTIARRASPAAPVLLLGLLVLAGCDGSGTIGSPTPQATGASPAATSALASETPAATRPTTTETDWGTIWDAVPPDFPVPQGAEPVESNEAVSIAWSSAGRPAQITTSMEAALRAAGWSIESASGPYEDGSLVIDAVRGAPECRAQVTVAPRGDEILVMVRYAAACPWSGSPGE